MKLAIVSIEDKRFAEHNGVDWKGTLTGLAGYVSGDVDTRGGSTIEQQYVKNYQLLVIAQTDAEKRAAVETTPARKLREIRMALTLDKTFTKPEILTRYLNLVSFGNGAFGIQDAAQTYFGIDASDLNWQQAALLAGLVQSTSTLNPYTNPDGALARRNLVLDTMIENLPEQGRRAARRQAAAAGHPAAAQRTAARLHRRRRPRLLLRLRAGVPGPRRHQQGPGRQGRLPDQDHARSRRPELGQAGRRLHGAARHPGHRQRDERGPAGQDGPPGGRDGEQPDLRPEHRLPAKPCSRSRSRWSATARGRSSRSSPPRPRWTWAWASTPTSTPRAASRPRGWAAAAPRAARRTPGACRTRATTAAR